MWQMASVDPDQSSAVSVVPMPSTDGSSMLISCSVLFAAATAAASESSMWSTGTSLSRSAIAEIATELATSPAACPPMPSAIASRCGPA